MAPIETEADKVQNNWEGREWRPMPLCMPALEDLAKEDVIDVLKLAIRPRSLPTKPGLSNTIKMARDALAAEPHNLLLINELGRLYASEAQWDKCANVLLRGWKRSKEIVDDSVRFRFLMKLAEVSLRLGKFRQALAVLQDMEEPEGGYEKKAYLVLLIQVHASNGDVQRALKSFQRAIEGESFDNAVRILALTLADLHKAGGFHAAKTAVEKLGAAYHNKSTLILLEQYAERQDSKKASRDPVKILMVVAAVLVVMFIVYALWLLEKWNLQRLALKK